MKRREFLRRTGGTAAVLAIPACGIRAAERRRKAPDASKMNVLFIDIEDMTANAVGCYGNPVVKTPAMDRFARGGVRFARAYCAVPCCNPSRTSFLHGLRPDTTRVYRNGQPMNQLLPKDAPSLPELLRRKGIHTINIGKLFHHTWTAQRQMHAFRRLEFCERPKGYQGVSKGYPKHLRDAAAKLPRPRFRFAADPAEEKRLAELLRRRNEIWKTAKKSSREYNRARALFQQPMANVFGDSGRLEEQEFDGKKARLAAHILTEMAREKKQFFLSVGFSRPHTPLLCPKKYLDLYDIKDIPPPAAPREKDKGIPPIARRFGRNYDNFNTGYKKPISDEIARGAVLAYYGCASFIDAQVGLILDTLRREGLAGNTVVIVFSDHGFQLGEHGLWSKYTLFEQATRVPLMMRVPGMTDHGEDCDGIVELVDLLPTLGELLELDTPPNLEGTSMVPLLRQPKQPWKRAAFSMLDIGGGRGRSVRTKRWRYAEWKTRGGVLKELYDLEADPWEQTNLAGAPEHSEQVNKMAALLKAGWSAAVPRHPASRAAGSPRTKPRSRTSSE